MDYNAMTYEEAKQTAACLLKDTPEQINIMHYDGNGEEFVAIAYSPLTDEERELTRNGGFRWDMLIRSEEHTSELQSRGDPDLVCRLLLEIGRATCRERV